jgi:pSer/pThr/pTyr-binding forkhead associated (FHA) protein
MASTNGSFVDGERLGGEPYALNPGQVVMFGSNVTLVYQAVPESDPMATVVAPVSMPYAEELTPDEPDELPAQEPFEVEEEVVIAEVVASDSLEAEEEEIAVEVAAPESVDIEEEEIAVEVAAPESVEIEEEEIAVEVTAPESFEVEEEEIAVEEAAPESVEIKEEEIVVDATILDFPDDVEEEEVVAAALVAEPDVYFEEPEDDEDLATIIDEPVIAEEPSPEPEIEPVSSEGFPTFDDEGAEPAEVIDQEVVPAPLVFEEPEPEPEMIQEPEVAATVIEEPLAPPDYGLDATMPDVDFQPVIEPPTETMKPSDKPKGGVDRTVIIAVVLLVVMCCCIFGTILALIAIDTWVEEDLIKGLELGAVWFFQGMKSLVR